MTNEAKRNEDTVEPLVRHGFLTRGGVIQKLRDGWELGKSGGMTSNAWMQPKLCAGGETLKVRLNTLWSMLDRGEIAEAQKHEKDPYWLTRYSLPNIAVSGGGGADVH